MESEQRARCVACAGFLRRSVFVLFLSFSDFFLFFSGSLFLPFISFVTLKPDITKCSPAFTSRIRRSRTRAQFGKTRTLSPTGRR